MYYNVGVFCSFLLSEIEKWKLNFTSVIELNEYLFLLSERDTFMLGMFWLGFSRGGWHGMMALCYMLWYGYTTIINSDQINLTAILQLVLNQFCLI